MKMLRKSSISYLFAFGVVVGLIVPTFACVNPNWFAGQGYKYTWPVDATVSVRISYFTSSEQTAVHDAFEVWRTTTGRWWAVNFSYSYSNSSISGENTIQVSHDYIDSSQEAPQALFSGNNNGFRRYSAQIHLNTLITNTTAIRQVMIHEIGHSFGLDECDSPQCTNTTDSVMVGGSSMNATNGLEALTSCDLLKVNMLYYAPGCPNSVIPTSDGSCPEYSSPDAGSAYCCEDGYCDGLTNYNLFQGTGCSSGFTANGGYCERSTVFQSDCGGNGYDGDSCECFQCIPDPNHFHQCLHCLGDSNTCENNGDNWSSTSCTCEYAASPIVVDISGNGFSLTSNANGVRFDLDSDNASEQLSWTSPNSDDAWLALDRNGNGTIDNGTELFGNFTPQPEPPTGEKKNGFLALAEYDKPTNGGNGDGKIAKQDSIFLELRLWQDTNHNGISESSELHSLKDLGLKSIDLDYHESKKQDDNGNWFKYRAKVKDTHDAQLGRWAWDVYLVGHP